MRAGDVMATDIAVIRADASLADATRLLVNTRASALPVVDSAGRLVGILSEADLLRIAAAPESGGGAPAAGRLLMGPVSSAMTREVVAVEEEAGVDAVAALMLARRVKRVPVVRSGMLAGMVTRLDLMKVLVARAGPAPVSMVGSVSDDQLRRDALAALHQLGVPLGSGFDVVARNGVLHLWGEVPDEDAFAACRRVAGQLAGVRDVFNHMHVRHLTRRRLA